MKRAACRAIHETVSRIARQLFMNRVTVAIVAVPVVLVALLFVVPVLARAQDNGPNHAGLVVRFGDGRVVTLCVDFPEPTISGLQLLERSGIPIVAQGGGIGAAVCKIEGEGCDYPTEDCFCKRDGQRSIYWAYSRLRDGAWVYSPLGASSTRVQPGDVDGWAWGGGDTQSGAKPPVLAFDQVCAVAAVQPTAGPPVPTVAPTRPRPTATPEPQPTVAPSAVPTEAATAVPTAVEPTVTGMPTVVAIASTVAPTVAVAIAPTATQTPQSSGNSGSPLNYIVFGVMVIALVVGIAVALRR